MKNQITTLLTVISIGALPALQAQSVATHACADFLFTQAAGNRR